MLRTLGALAAIGCVLAACSSPAPHTNPVVAKEQAAVAPLKVKYKDVVTGVDVQGRTLILYVEPNAMYSMDEDAQDAMYVDALQRWKKAWASAHPHEHATVTLSVRDYFGRKISASTAKV
ncbi:MAG TPA: hypothetical protein VKT72_15555 [Candidatus Baltobacteraceae bacterium]|nr:hypothetical protein [Candidatus Baltobacteraceae bacterium]